MAIRRRLPVRQTRWSCEANLLLRVTVRCKKCQREEGSGTAVIIGVPEQAVT
jgi:hypothetical protein